MDEPGSFITPATRIRIVGSMRILLALLALVLFAASAVAQTSPAAAPPAQPACATCAGAGRIEQACAVCSGAGTRPCPFCTGDWGWLADRGRLATLGALPAGTRLTEELARKIEETLRLEVTKLRAAALPKGDETPRGKIPCVALCSSAAASPDRAERCKPCGKTGWMPCSFCRTKSTVQCFECLGEKKTMRACPECAGGGRAPDVLERTAADVDRCTWCGGTEIRACDACDAEGRREQTCDTCIGRGSTLCGSCSGTQKVLCLGCLSTGRDALDPTGKGGPCKHCGQRGYLTCRKCESGRVECQPCGGAGRGRLPCAFGGKRVTPCAGCWDGAVLRWTTSATRLAAVGRLELAETFLEAALRRAETRARRRTAIHADDPDEKRAADERLANVRKALRRQLEGLRKPR